MTNRYAHLSPAHLRGAVERLEGLTRRSNAPRQHMIQHKVVESSPLSRGLMRNLASDWTRRRSQVVKATVCKTVTRRFESARRLHFLLA